MKILEKHSKKITKVLENQLKNPTFDKWAADDEVKLITQLATSTLPEKHNRIQVIAQQLYLKYLVWMITNRNGGMLPKGYIDNLKRLFKNQQNVIDNV